jgi:chromosome segregation ATPase
VEENDHLRKSQGELELKYSQEWQSKLTNYESRIRQSTMDRDNFEIKYKQLVQEYEETRRRLAELSDLNRKLAEYENRIALMSQEIERLNGALRQKAEETSGYQLQLRQLQEHNEELRRGNADSGVRITQITQEYSTKITTYETRIKQYNVEIDELNRRILELTNVSSKVAEHESLVRRMRQEIEMLTNQLGQKNEENINLEKRLRALQQELDLAKRGTTDFEYKITQISQEYQTKILGYESRIKQVSGENEELRRRLQDLGDINKKISEYEYRNTQLSQEVERLNGVLKLKVDEI